MGFRGAVFGLGLLLGLATCANAQNQEKTSAAIGTPNARTESHQVVIPPGKGCAAYNFTNVYPMFNYTAALGLATLPQGCDVNLLRFIKQYTAGACPETRANNYKVPSLKITNTCTDNIVSADLKTCQNVFAKAPPSAFAPKGIGASSIIDRGTVCWPAPTVFYFIENGCTQPVTATIKLTTDAYSGTCVDEADSDDGGDDAGGPGSAREKSSKGGSGLSSGAKAGIAIGVIAAVVIIAAAVWFCCCQLGKA